MALLTSVIAKVLVVVDEILNAYVTFTSSEEQGAVGCNIVISQFDLTNCGTALIYQLQTIIFNALYVVNVLLAGLGATTTAPAA
ncbi:hypothetical protein ACFLXV_00670 [Chloroflexota bacterium]